MIDAIDRIETYAARALPESTRLSAPEIEWKKITGMRHVLVHDYFGIDHDVLWNTVEKDLRPLKASLVTLLDQLS